MSSWSEECAGRVPNSWLPRMSTRVALPFWPGGRMSWQPFSPQWSSTAAIRAAASGPSAAAAGAAASEVAQMTASAAAVLRRTWWAMVSRTSIGGGSQGSCTTRRRQITHASGFRERLSRSPFRRPAAPPPGLRGPPPAGPRPATSGNSDRLAAPDVTGGTANRGGRNRPPRFTARILRRVDEVGYRPLSRGPFRPAAGRNAAGRAAPPGAGAADRRRPAPRKPGRARSAVALQLALQPEVGLAEPLQHVLLRLLPQPAL